jgi:CheY-like chemotaxis protein
MAKTKHTILCVDDEKTVLDSLKNQLRGIFGDSYNYEIAQNGKEALEVVDELQEDSLDVIVVISDYIMPGMYGDEFLIKLHAKYPNIRKIMLTGQADDNAVKRARDNANLLFCLRKPWSQEELAKIVKMGLDG